MYQSKYMCMQQANQMSHIDELKSCMAIQTFQYIAA